MGPIIRLATEDDAAAVQAIYAPFCEATPVSFETQAPSVEAMRSRITSTLSAFPWLIYQVDDRVLGYAYASKHRERPAYCWSVDVSAYVSDGARGVGIGRALYTSLFALLRLQGFTMALAGITIPNAGSVGLHEAMGFELIGVYRAIGYKCGAWQDVAWYQCPLGEQSGEPAEPISLSAARLSPDWARALGLGLETRD
jgi:phosphinothricin acetyltransferase